MNIKSKYAVGLSILTNSFFDPECGANLFKSSPVYQFDHKPTNRIITAVKSGRLVDIKKNILDDGSSQAETVDVKKMEKDIKAKLEKDIRAELEKEYATKLEEAKANIEAEAKVEVAEEATAVAEENKPANKGKK